MGRFSGTNRVKQAKEAELASRLFVKLLPALLNEFPNRISASLQDEAKPHFDIYLNDENGVDLKPSMTIAVDAATREISMGGENVPSVTLGHVRRTTTFNRAVRRCLGEMTTQLDYLESPQGRTKRALRMA